MSDKKKTVYPPKEEEHTSNYGSVESLVSSKASDDAATHNYPANPPATPTSGAPNLSGATIEDLGDTGSPLTTRSGSQTATNQDLGGAPGATQNNNTALPPDSQLNSKPNMIPLALLKKSSNNAVDESPNGIMQMISCKNKVAPAEQSPAPTTTVGAVLMMIPKKSDASLQRSEADSENNPAVDCQECKTDGASSQQDAPSTVVKPTPSYDSYEDVCRICHDNPSKMELISPCLCKGSMSKVHRSCLERWLAESAKNVCEICNYEYNTVRKPKYTGCASVFQWIRNPLSPSDMRNLFFDIACFFILTPLAAISSWLCVVGAQHYSFGPELRRRRFKGPSSWDVHSHDSRSDASNSTWTAVGLLSLTGTLLVAYTVWLFVAIKYHIQAWREWQQRNYTVTIVPFEDGRMGHPPAPRPPPETNANNNNANGGENLLGGYDNGQNYEFDLNPSMLRYSGNSPIGRGGRNQFRASRHNRRNYNLRPIFSRSHFLRNPPPGYTISETTMLYQALYGSDSDAFLNENILSLFADSSEEVTENNSAAHVESQMPPGHSGADDRPHTSSDSQATGTAEKTVEIAQETNERKPGGLKIDQEMASSSGAANNNPKVKVGESKQSQEGVANANSHVAISIYDDDNDNPKK